MELVREQMENATDIIDTIERERLNWYGHLRRMSEKRWPLKIWHWKPVRRRKKLDPNIPGMHKQCKTEI